MTTTEPAPPDVPEHNYNLRPEPKMTLRQLRKHFDTGTETIVVDVPSITVDAKHAAITFKAKDGTNGTDFEAPLSQRSVEELSDWLKLPKSFMQKTEPDIRQWLFDRQLHDHIGEIMFDVNVESGIFDVRPVGKERIDPRRIVDVAQRVVGEDATVLEGWQTSKEYQFDVVVAEGAEYGIGGDPAVNDLTRGGLRFSQKLDQPLKPSVAKFFYRLICTNGMETPTVTDLNLRKATSVAEVITALEEAAQEAFGAVEHEIEAFYDLRNVRVKEPEQLVLRMGRERHLPAGVMHSLVERLPALLTPSDTNMFEVVNAITNQANHPDLFGQAATRRNLEATGGQALEDHAHRCPRCQSALVGS